MSQFGNCQYSNSEIQKLFITKWSTDIIPYFDTSGNLTALTGLTDFWNEIKINTVRATFVQVMNPPNPNGINYTETLEILVPHADLQKWLDIYDILVDRYTIVFQDANDKWFCFGWRFGTKVVSYTLEENQYGLSFINDFSTALLTTISESYVTLNII